MKETRITTSHSAEVRDDEYDVDVSACGRIVHKAGTSKEHSIPDSENLGYEAESDFIIAFGGEYRSKPLSIPYKSFLDTSK